MKLEFEENPWKKSEDETIKLGVMKYGFNKWNKISSLMTKRTPLECKERWNKHLCVSKEEWSSKDIEKLIELGKSFNSQWELIGRIMEKKPSECYEKYNLSIFKSIKVVKHPELEEAEKEEFVDEEKMKMIKDRVSSYKKRKLERKRQRSVKQKNKR